jgi:hypothetical protein
MSHDIHSDRFNIYIAVHKGLRSFMCDTLSRLGRLDVRDADEMSTTLGQVRHLLDACLSHLTHENDFLHVAMEARAGHSSRKTAMDHAEHLQTISALREKAQALELAPVAMRDMLSLGLYRELALFIAENFEHMHFEETVNCAALWVNYSDDELFEIHRRLVSSLSPKERLDVVRWTAPACTPFERTTMFKQMREQSPPEAYLGALSHVLPHIDHAGWTKLTRSLKVAQAPGLVALA